MSKSTKSPGSESGRPIEGTRSGIIEWRGARQQGRECSGGRPRKGWGRQIPGVDIADYIRGSLDDDAAEEEGDELDEAEAVEEEARANQRWSRFADH